MSNDVSERERFEAEQKLRQAELDIRKREIAVKEIEAQRSSGFLGRLGPVGVGIFVAGIGLIGGVVTTSMQNIYQRELERTKAEGTLILELAKAADLERAQKNMQWFLRAGFIRDPTGEIAASLENKENVPFLPALASIRRDRAQQMLPDDITNQELAPPQ
jgi:hypothetical protein